MDESRNGRLYTLDNLFKAVRKPGLATRMFKDDLHRRFVKLTSDNYDEFYLRRTKRNVSENPAAAVGPAELFDEMRQWQMDFLSNQGLEPTDMALDLGCGVLRGGIPLIDFLNEGNYYGMDISQEALEVGREEIQKEGLGHKHPTLIHNDDLTFDERPLAGVSFDYVWAQSVLTHLPPDHLDELLTNVHKPLKDGGVFFATYHRSEKEMTMAGNSETDFFYSLDYMKMEAQTYGLTVEDISVEHPNDLQMLKFQHS